MQTDPSNITAPHDLAVRIRARIRKNVGDHYLLNWIALNRLLTKFARKVDKPNGITIWHPHSMPDPLCKLPLEDLPGVGQQTQPRPAPTKSPSNIFGTSLRALSTPCDKDAAHHGSYPAFPHS